MSIGQFRLYFKPGLGFTDSMQAQESQNDFFIWGIDDSAYGPIELPTLMEWVRDDRVLAETWVYRRADGAWRRAGDLPEVQMILRRKSGSPATAQPVASGALTPGALRRIKILADLNDAQLDQLAQFLELKKVPQWTVVVKQGDSGDAMYLVLEGELRARVTEGTKETILATFGPGEFFGDMTLFDNGPRSADVVANAESVLLILTAASFEKMTKESPSLATPFLQATARTLAARIRADNKRLDRVRQQFSTSMITRSATVPANPE